jgi:hypothetical protein
MVSQKVQVQKCFDSSVVTRMHANVKNKYSFFADQPIFILTGLVVNITLTAVLFSRFLDPSLFRV